MTGAVGLRPRAGPVQDLPGQGGRARHGRDRAGLPHHEQQLGVHGRRPRARLPCRRGAPGHGVHPVPSDGHGVAAVASRASSSPKACAARAASSRTRKAAASCSTTSPPSTPAQTADNEEEGWRYVTGDKNARRPPELLTRDHVARCIMREVKAGRGSPHGGVFLDIAWIKEHIPNAAEHIKKKLPSMYHQFKQLADLDITEEPMEVGPTTHYMMGGIRVDGDTQMSTVPGLFAAGECGGRAARREPPRRQLALGPPRLRQARRGTRRRVRQGERRRERERRPGRRPPRGRPWPRSTGAARARTRTPSSARCRTRCRISSASSGTRTT